METNVMKLPALVCRDNSGVLGTFQLLLAPVTGAGKHRVAALSSGEPSWEPQGGRKRANFSEKPLFPCAH